MKVWVDANLSPALAPWMNQELRCDASSAQWLGLLTATDSEIFEKAPEEDVVILTKD